jgi:hypothetical protein
MVRKLRLTGFPLFYCLCCAGRKLLLLAPSIAVAASASSASSTLPPSIAIRLPGRPYSTDDDGDAASSVESSPLGSWVGTGREFDIFDTRGGQTSPTSHENSNIPPSNRQASSTSGSNKSGGGVPDERILWNENDEFVRSASRRSSDGPFRTPSSFSSRSTSTTGSGSSARSNRYGGTSTRSSRSFNKEAKSFFQPVADWWSSTISPNIKSWPKIQCRVEPTTTLKIRKTFRPLKTIVRLGADFNTQLGVWQFKSSWEDDIIGGKLTLAGRELQFSKSWQVSVGAVEDLVTRLRFRAAVDLQTWKAYARVGFRTERLSPINVMEGFTLLKQVPLDGTKGHVKLEVKANFALPEPEIEYSTETQRSLIGMGDIEVNIEELNLVLDY